MRPADLGYRYQGEFAVLDDEKHLVSFELSQLWRVGVGGVLDSFYEPFCLSLKIECLSLRLPYVFGMLIYYLF